MDAFQSLPIKDQIEFNERWAEYVDREREDIRHYETARCDKCVRFQIENMTYYESVDVCSCARKRFEDSWVKEVEQENIRREQDLEVERTPKCAFCENQPDVFSTIGIVCWDCFARKGI